MTRKFNRSKKLNAKYLLHFGYDHLDAVKHLLQQKNVRYFESAGYLISLGFELILKAWILHIHKEFPNTHRCIDLFELIKSADGSISISPTDLKILQDISVYSDLRYPDKAGEIGDDDLEAIEKLDDFLWQILPQNLISIYENINPAHKGYRRILLTKRKS